MNNKYLLPYGDTLREFLNDGGISKSDLRTLVRNRGIFVSQEEKSAYIPILTKTGITPRELDELKENFNIREVNPKRHTQSIKCESNCPTLISAIPPNYRVNELVKKEFGNYRLLGSPTFKTVENDHDCVELDFKIERYDFTQSWTKNTTQFEGKVKLRKKNDTLDINISLSHTSEETKEVANKIAKDIVSKFKESGYINQAEATKKIRFIDFTNENRIKFLRKLSQEHSRNELNFKDTKDIGFCPDPEKDYPQQISWMQKKVKNLVIQGEQLHSTFFIKQKELHEFIQIYKIEAAYSFTFLNYEGTCSISFEFPDFISKENLEAELIIKVTSVQFKENKTSITQKKMKEILLSELEEAKLSLYNEHKK